MFCLWCVGILDKLFLVPFLARALMAKGILERHGGRTCQSLLRVKLWAVSRFMRVGSTHIAFACTNFIDEFLGLSNGRAVCSKRYLSICEEQRERNQKKKVKVRYSCYSGKNTYAIIQEHYSSIYLEGRVHIKDLLSEKKCE